MYEGARSPATGVTDSCELPCGYWELNPGPLEEQPVLLTTEPSPQPEYTILNAEFFSCKVETESYWSLEEVREFL